MSGDVDTQPAPGAATTSGVEAWRGTDPVLRALEALAGAPVDGVDDDALCRLAARLERARRFLDAAEAHVNAELDARDATDTAHGLRTPRWLAREAQLPIRLGKERVRVAQALRTRLPAADRALTDGTIGWEHARVLADAANPRIADRLDLVVPALLTDVERTRFDVWRREVLDVANALDEDGPHDPDRDEPVSTASMASTIDGLLSLQATLFGGDALTVEQALTGIVDDRYRRYRRDHERCPDIAVPSRPELLGEALAELARRATRAGDGATTPEVTLVLDGDQLGWYPDGPTPSDTHDHDHHGDGARARGDRSESRPPRLRPPEGSLTTRTSATQSAIWLCTAEVIAVVLDSLGVPLDLGRTIRYANRAQRRALANRDGGCVFPGCDAPPDWTDAHHVIHWPHGGTTDVPWLASLCRHHHRITHRPGWTMHATPDGWFHWRTPTGRTFWSQRHGTQRTGPIPAQRWEPQRPQAPPLAA